MIINGLRKGPTRRHKLLQINYLQQFNQHPPCQVAKNLAKKKMKKSKKSFIQGLTFWGIGATLYPESKRRKGNKMTKKHFEIIAKAIRNCTAFDSNATAQEIVQELCLAFKKENPKFDAEKFKKVCFNG